MPINFNIILFYVFGHVCYVAVHAKTCTPATWFVSRGQNEPNVMLTLAMDSLLFDLLSCFDMMKLTW